MVANLAKVSVSRWKKPFSFKIDFWSAQPTPTKPALLSHDDTVTFFHEMGHAFHGRKYSFVASKHR